MGHFRTRKLCVRLIDTGPLSQRRVLLRSLIQAIAPESCMESDRASVKSIDFPSGQKLRGKTKFLQ